MQHEAPDAELNPQVEPALADDFVERYFCWQDECVAVDHAYEQWRSTVPRDRALAYAAYRAALDREEHAAAVFRASAGQIFGSSK